jgi:tetratricopeptide (TPR) repeat protein
LTATLVEGRRLLLTGYGGAGKTALAATLADHWLAAGHGPVLWLNAHVDTIEPLFEALLVPFGAHHELTNLRGDARIYAVRQILTREAVGAVVLDDLRTVALFPQIQQAVPATVALLITSRHTIASIDSLYAMPPLPLADAVALLATQAANARLDEASYRADPQAAVLCAELNRHPLGVVIAGAWLKQRTASVAELLSRLAAAHAEPLTIEMPPEFRGAGSATVKAVLDQTYQALSKRAQALLRAFGVLPEPHSTADFLMLYTGEDQWVVNDLIAELIAWNFLTRVAPDFYEMHDVVHSYAELRTRTIRHVEAKRLTATAKAYTATRRAALPQLHHNLPNLLAAAAAADDADCLAIVAPLALDGYQDRFGYRFSYLELLDRGLRFLAAKAAAATAAECRQLHHLLSKRGNAYFDQTAYRQAVVTYEHALTYAYNDERRAIVLALIGKARRFAGDSAAAEQVFQRAYRIARAAPQPALLSFVLEQQAHAAGHHGDHETARRVAAEQVAINEALVQADPSPEHRLSLFYALNNLASAELQLGQKPLYDVLQLACRAEALATLINSEEIKAHAAWGLTEIYHAMGDRVQAAHHMQRALAIYEAQGKVLDAEEIHRFMAQHRYPHEPTPTAPNSVTVGRPLT